MNTQPKSLRRWSHFGCLLAMAGSTSAFIPTARAQTAPAEETIRLSEFTVRGSQDIGWRATTTLSGTRANVDLKTFPKTIQVLTGEFLEDLRTESLGEAMHFVSNAIPMGRDNAAFGHNNYMMRGFVQIRQYRNGIGEVSQITTDVALIDRVEVTKGPSSLLAGSAPPGGVINYITKKPLSYARNTATLTLGSWDAARGVIDLSSPITASKSLSYRFIGVYEDKKGFLEFERYKKMILAPSLSWRIAKNTVLDAGLEYSKQDTNPGSNDSYNFAQTELAGEAGLLPWSYSIYGPNSDVDRESTQVHVELQHKFSENLTLRAIAAYQDNYKEDFRPVFTFRFLDAAQTLLGNALNRRDGTWDRDSRGFWAYQSDLIWRTEAGAFKNTLVLGLEQQEFYKDQVRIDSRLNAPFVVSRPDYFIGDKVTDFIFPLLNRSEDSREVRRAVNLLGQTSTLGGRLHLMAGVRKEDSDKFRKDRPPATAQENFDAVTVNGGFSWQAHDRVTFYGTYSESFMPPGNGLRFPDLPLDPESGEGIDFGVRTTWLENRLSFNATVFDLTRFNISRPDLLNTGFVLQSGEEESRGIELESVAQLSKTLAVYMSYGYVKGRVVSNVASPALEGTPLLGVPRHNGAVKIKFAPIQSGDLQGVTLSGAVIMNDRRYGQITPATGVITHTLDPWSRVDLGASYRTKFGSHDFNISLDVLNVLDERYYLGAGLFGKAPPRNFRVTTVFSF